MADGRQGGIDAGIGFAGHRLQILTDLQHVLVAQVFPGELAKILVAEKMSDGPQARFIGAARVS